MLEDGLASYGPANKIRLGSGLIFGIHSDDGVYPDGAAVRYDLWISD